jgi:uncharacterized metal-binding protein
MFQYKPLEKSAKKEKDYTGQSAIRMKLRFMDFILMPIERTYDAIEGIPLIGPIVSFSRTAFVVVIASLVISFVLIILVAMAALIAVQLSEWAGPSY